MHTLYNTPPQHNDKHQSKNTVRWISDKKDRVH